MFLYIDIDAMRTTLDISEDLIKKAMKLTGAKTKSQVVKEALEELLNREKRLNLLNFKGKIDLNIDLDQLRDRK
ncbi:MAG: type II toxin-antitoxin system VapB family antitoxin [Cyclobacteriaceae bacterium]